MPTAEQHASEIVVAKGGAVYFAPKGTTLPANTAPRNTLDGRFLEVGYASEDGVVLNATPDILEIMAWQSGRPVRRDAQTRNYTVSFGLLQWNSENLTLAFGGGSAYTTAAGVTTYEWPADTDALDEVALVVDWEDQGYKHRMVWERGNVTDGVETNLIRTGPATLPVTYSVLDPATLSIPGFYVTNSPAFGPVS